MSAPRHLGPEAWHALTTPADNREAQLSFTRMPRAAPSDTTFTEARLPGRIADHLKMRLRHFRGPLFAMEYDRETSRAFWMSATADEILLVVIPGLSEDETFEVQSRLMQIGEPNRVDRVCGVCAAVTGRTFVEKG